MQTITIEHAQIGSLFSLYRQAARKKISWQAPDKPSLAAQVLHLQIDPQHFQKYQQFFAYNAPVPNAPYFYLLAQKAQLWFLTLPQFVFKPMGMVHLGVSFNQLGALELKADYQLQLDLHSVRTCKAGVIFEVRARFVIGDAPVLEINNIYLNRIKNLSPEPLPQLFDFKEDLPESQNEVLYYRQKRIRRYAILSKDINPIHLSRLSARAFGFRRAIVHGMYNVCSIYSVIYQHKLSCAYNPHRSIFAFKSAVFLPATAQLAHQVQNQQCDVVLSGKERVYMLAHFQETTPTGATFG